MIADALDGQPRSLAQYAEELRTYLADLESLVASQSNKKFLIDRCDDLRRKLLAVEREINWRMGI